MVCSPSALFFYYQELQEASAGEQRVTMGSLPGCVWRELVCVCVKQNDCMRDKDNNIGCVCMQAPFFVCLCDLPPSDRPMKTTAGDCCPPTNTSSQQHRAKVTPSLCCVCVCVRLCVCVCVLTFVELSNHLCGGMYTYVRSMHILAYLCTACVLRFTQQDQGSCFHPS